MRHVRPLLLLLLRMCVAVALLRVLALVLHALLSGYCGGTGGRALQHDGVLSIEPLEAALQPCHLHARRRRKLRGRDQPLRSARAGTDVGWLLGRSSRQPLMPVAVVATAGAPSGTRAPARGAGGTHWAAWRDARLLQRVLQRILLALVLVLVLVRRRLVL